MTSHAKHVVTIQLIAPSAMQQPTDNSQLTILATASRVSLKLPTNNFAKLALLTVSLAMVLLLTNATLAITPLTILIILATQSVLTII